MKSRTPLLKYLKFNKVLNCAPVLDKITKTKNSKLRNKYLKDANDCVIDAISEIAKNCLTGNVPLKTCDFKQLSKYQKLLRKLSKKSPVVKRRNLIIQSGGFIPFLIPPALSLIASVVGELIGKRIRK